PRRLHLAGLDLVECLGQFLDLERLHDALGLHPPDDGLRQPGGVCDVLAGVAVLARGGDAPAELDARVGLVGFHLGLPLSVTAWLGRTEWLRVGRCAARVLPEGGHQLRLGDTVQYRPTLRTCQLPKLGEPKRVEVVGHALAVGNDLHRAGWQRSALRVLGALRGGCLTVGALANGRGCHDLSSFIVDLAHQRRGGQSAVDDVRCEHHELAEASPGRLDLGRMLSARGVCIGHRFAYQRECVIVPYAFMNASVVWTCRFSSSDLLSSSVVHWLSLCQMRTCQLSSPVYRVDFTGTISILR